MSFIIECGHSYVASFIELLNLQGKKVIDISFENPVKAIIYYE